MKRRIVFVCILLVALSAAGIARARWSVQDGPAPWEGWQGYDKRYFDPYEATLSIDARPPQGLGNVTVMDHSPLQDRPSRKGPSSP